MAKTKKKRTKAYRGADAKSNTPVVTRIAAEDLSAREIWWRKHKKRIITGLKVGAVIAFLAFMIYELMSMAI